MHILLADDEPMVRDLIKMMIEFQGHTVVVAVDGREALNFYEAGKFDLVLTDFHMPFYEGPALAQHIRAINPQQKIVLLTGTMVSARPGSLFEEVLEKPVRSNRLVDCLRRMDSK